MLSRIADSLYWMSRYLERAEYTARLVEINLIHAVEAESALSETAEWRPLLAICGNEEAYRAVGGSEVVGARVIDFLTRERRNDASIRTSLRLARENARVVRDRISLEMWEHVNELWLHSEDRLQRPISAEYYRWLRGQVDRFHGATSSTMMRGEAFGFYLLGFFLERADMTCRILDVKYHLLLPDLSLVGSALDYYQWGALLKALSGFEPYRRKHPQLLPLAVAEFVMLDGEFPRSLRFAVDRMEQALSKVGRAREPSAALRAVAALRARLHENTAESLFDQGLHDFLGGFLAGISKLHEAVRDEYFAAHLALNRTPPAAVRAETTDACAT
jgi:uncharacterized alpha-E superfamily protein